MTRWLCGIAMPNLVLGTAVHLPLAQIVPFVTSCKQHCAQADIALLVAPNEDQEKIQWLRSQGVILVHWTSVYFIQTRLHNSRYIRYLEFLLDHTSYDRVFLTDVSDVIFQRDIFVEICDPGLHVFREDHRYTLGSQSLNASWIESNYGAQGLQQIGHQPILCSGTTLGCRDSVIHYITYLLQERSPAKFVALGGREDDQAPHNWIVHHGIVNATQHVNGHGVATLFLVPDEELAVTNNEILLNGIASAVVHQYNKKPHLQSWVQAKYASAPTQLD
jgi:hypothetical protein